MDDSKKKTVGFNRMTPEERKEASRKGGLAVSANREHMRWMSQLAQEAKRKKRDALLNRSTHL